MKLDVKSFGWALQNIKGLRQSIWTYVHVVIARSKDDCGVTRENHVVLKKDCLRYSIIDKKEWCNAWDLRSLNECSELLHGFCVRPVLPK